MAVKMKTTIGTRTKARRLELALTQKQLALRCGGGVSQPSIYQVENGETEHPRFLLGLAQALGVTPQWLTGESDSPSPAGYSNGHGLPVLQVRVLGHTLCDEFRAAALWSAEDANSGHPYWITSPRDERFNGAERTGFEVRGEEMNQAYLPGSLVVAIATVGRQPEPGDKLIVYRYDQSGRVELSLKELATYDGRLWLRALSTNPRHAEQWPAAWSANDWQTRLSPRPPAGLNARNFDTLSSGRFRLQIPFRIVAALTLE
jgi:transcriptional regulator with XRE-family HTH domain